ncbi:glycosyltransferase [Rhodoferax sp. 4810]|uniref:Glycosyltransferase n=1 Tax=Thiospirillum jenense TaxID=1653858 RepID=A0A839HD81_9GAMM|nr:glycosyltransferase family 2 protein [Thiospirillum jenense]MBB1073041.1 glycosyltransferase [Rhodoferax jenense]MBB1124989.1 glycosyltransferase [Thiospirillum jenense]
MVALELLVEFLLTVSLAMLAVMSAHLGLLALARWSTHRPSWLPSPPRLIPASPLTNYPDVLVQLPLFNEGELVTQILTAVTALDWPRDKLWIQVLDDSTDDSLITSRRAVAAVKHAGFHVELLHRRKRTAFKAGALAAGLRRSTAAYVAIFDADFQPPPDFLQRTVGVLLANTDLAYVQTRWGHANRDHSLLTRAQARLLDGHFRVEQEARDSLGLPAPFNGTCGVWRRTAINSAGGWHGDTLTEDLDLSLRARLHGWRAAYLSDLVVPGVLPTSPRAWRTQQFRWTKGFAQCGIKLLPAVWSSPRLFHWQRLMITLQLIQPLAFLFGILCLLLGLPFIAGNMTPGYVLTAVALITSGVGLIGPIAVLLLGGRGEPKLSVLRDALIAMVLTAGLLLSNARAGFEAMIGFRSDFIRTPKARLHTSNNNQKRWWRCGLAELIAGFSLLIFSLLEAPAATVSLTLVIGGLLSFGLMQAHESGAFNKPAQIWARLGE